MKRKENISLTLGADLIAELERRAAAATCSVSLLVRQYVIAGIAARDQSRQSDAVREISPAWGKASVDAAPAAIGAKRRPRIQCGGEMSA